MNEKHGAPLYIEGSYENSDFMLVPSVILLLRNTGGGLPEKNWSENGSSRQSLSRQCFHQEERQDDFLSERQFKDRWEDNPTAEWDARAMAVHAAMVDRVDQGIGQIIDALR